jgi:hypothetical protein
VSTFRPFAAVLLGALLLAPGRALAAEPPEAPRASPPAGPAPAQPAPPPASGPDPNTIVLATCASLAGAALIAGAVFAGLYAMKGSEAASDDAKVPKSAPCPRNGNGAAGNCGDIVSALNAQATFGTAAVGTLVAGAGVGIVTLVSALMSPRAPPPPVAPVVIGHGAGLVLRGSF